MDCVYIFLCRCRYMQQITQPIKKTVSTSASFTLFSNAALQKKCEFHADRIQKATGKL